MLTATMLYLSALAFNYSIPAMAIAFKTVQIPVYLLRRY